MSDLLHPWISSGMTLPLYCHQTREVTLSCMAEIKGVSSRANLLISIRYLWVKFTSPGHHAMIVTFNQSLFYCEIKYKERKIKGR
jgi:hypothetical protein